MRVNDSERSTSRNEDILLREIAKRRLESPSWQWEWCLEDSWRCVYFFEIASWIGVWLCSSRQHLQPFYSRRQPSWKSSNHWRGRWGWNICLYNDCLFYTEIKNLSFFLSSLEELKFRTSNGKSFSSLLSSALDYALAAFCSHANQKAMVFLPFSFVGLECSFHRSLLYVRVLSPIW